MALATGTKMPDSHVASVLWRSALARRTAALNFLGLTILIIGALALNDLRKGLVDAKIETLEAQAQLMASILGDGAVIGGGHPHLDPLQARRVLLRLPLPTMARARLFDLKGQLVADTGSAAGVSTSVARIEGVPVLVTPPPPPKAAHAAQVMSADLAAALDGEVVAAERVNAMGRRVASVAMPVYRNDTILAALIIETGDIEAVIEAERRSLIPFILVAVMVTLASVLWLVSAVVRPLARLARASDAVRLGLRRHIDLPELSRRTDEIGDLSRALSRMTRTLTDQADANARFAADVAHEIKNPLASIRSAAETLSVAKDAAARQQLMTIMAKDVARMDRLITETLQASRLDAELARAPLSRLDLGAVLQGVVAAYDVSHPGQVVLIPADAVGFWVRGVEDSLARVVRNLIDNALSFSAAVGQVRMTLSRNGKPPHAMVTLTVEDDGPGLPVDALHRVFDRYYTQRPVSSARDGHSGLGLAIVKQIVEACGGQIEAQNNTDADGTVRGARFIVMLPEAT